MKCDPNQSLVTPSKFDSKNLSSNVFFNPLVGLHELLGHGSGKLLRKEADGSLNFPGELVNPLDGMKVSKMYEPGETYDSKFTRLGSAYEECRAECVGLYLSTDKDVLNIFNISDNDEMVDITYTNWFSLCHAAMYVIIVKVHFANRLLKM